MVPKYPRIAHLPWSPGGTSDDRRLSDVSPLIGAPLVITEKMDGSNLCMTRERVYARTHAHPPVHASFDLAKALGAKLRSRLPERESIFGEWCYARHSIGYRALPGYLLVFGVRDESDGSWRSWDETRKAAGDLSLPTVPELWRGIVANEKELMRRIHEALVFPSTVGGEREGVVVRLAGTLSDFERSMAKWVRAHHVQTDEHWSRKPIIRNQLGSE